MSYAFDKNRVYTALEMAQVIVGKPESWFLLEILEEDDYGKAKALKILQHSAEKEILYDYLMEDESWDWNKKYIFVYSDPDKKCELL